MNKIEIINRLVECDKNIEAENNENKKFSCYICGGAALALCYNGARLTRDIDVLKHTATEVRGISSIFEKNDINCDASAYFDYFPSGFAGRAKKLDLDTKCVDYYVLSLEDIVISKLCTSGRDKDFEDIENEDIASEIDWDKLSELADSMKSTMISSLSYDNFRYNYEEYVRNWKGLGYDS